MVASGTKLESTSKTDSGSTPRMNITWAIRGVSLQSFGYPSQVAGGLYPQRSSQKRSSVGCLLGVASPCRWATPGLNTLRFERGSLPVIHTPVRYHWLWLSWPGLCAHPWTNHYSQVSVHCSDWPARHGTRPTRGVEDDGWSQSQSYIVVKAGSSCSQGHFLAHTAKKKKKRRWLLSRQIRRGSDWVIERLLPEGGLSTRIAPTPRYDPGGTSRAGFRPCLATATLVCHPTHRMGFWKFILSPVNPQISYYSSTFLLCPLALGEGVGHSFCGLESQWSAGFHPPALASHEPVPSDLWLREPNHAVSSKAMSRTQASVFAFWASVSLPETLNKWVLCSISSEILWINKSSGLVGVRWEITFNKYLLYTRD